MGIAAQWFAWRVKVPAILPLIITGLVVGPLSTLWTKDGSKWLEPIYHADSSSGLFPSEYLFYFVSLAIGIILFEGGLTLKRKEIRHVGRDIVRLISVGSIITFLGAGLAAYFLLDLSGEISFLFAALVIVTGPTVIAPILQNVPLNRNVTTVLKWEGILIDPIGALVAVLIYELIVSGQGAFAFSPHALITFIKILLTGLSLGAIAAFGLYWFLKKEWIPHYLLNVVTLALVLAVFVFSDLLYAESGLVTVVVMGMVLGNLDVPRIKDILDFKESLSLLLISILFILLAAHINMQDMMRINNWQSIILLLIIILVIRPLGVFVSTYKGGLAFREKLFISWVGPRGIVAAGIASLFGLKLVSDGVEGAEYITPLVFMVVLGTVLLNATTARPIAKLFNVIQQSSEGVLFIGASPASRIIAKFLRDKGRHVVLVDSNQNNINKSQALGLEAFQANVYTDDLNEYFELVDMAYLLAMTPSAEVNEYVCSHYEKIFGEKGTFRVRREDELKVSDEDLDCYFPSFDDYLNLSEAARDFPVIHEVPVSTSNEFLDILSKIRDEPKSIPLFLRESDGQFQIIPQDLSEINILPDYQLIYIGKEVHG